MKTPYSSGWLLFCLLAVSECDPTVVGIEGQSVTLPCKHDSHGEVAICWGRELIRLTGCTNEIISTDGTTVTNRGSDRYQLLGDMKKGDVSLTILNATEKDSGTYGCRVQIQGWFNDLKSHVSLTIEKPPVPTTSGTPEFVTRTSQTPDNYTQDHMSTNSTPYFKKSETEQGRSGHLAAVLVSILLVLVFMAIVAIFVFRMRWRRINTVLRIPQSSTVSVRYRNSNGSLSLNTREMAVENIYELDSRDVDDEDGP